MHLPVHSFPFLPVRHWPTWLAIFLGLSALSAQLSASLFTDRALDRDQMAAAVKSAGVPYAPAWAAKSYAVLNRAELVTFQALFLARLSKAGIPVSLPTGRSGWQPRFNCWSFCQAFIVEASYALTLELFHSWSPAERAAIVPCAVRMGDGTIHALLLILTDQGPLWWDPQAGQHRPLTPTELSTIWFPQS